MNSGFGVEQNIVEAAVKWTSLGGDREKLRGEELTKKF
jgi:hypothetical protein